ncbi:CpmK protein [Klebsiella sp. T2.Ur]|nr:CpmK protein [Klebsiella sp. T2.Ur]
MRKIFHLLLLLFPFCVQAGHEIQYRQMIDSYLSKRPLCLGEKQFPVSIRMGSDRWVSARMEALVDGGLLTSHIESGRKIWRLTPYGQKSFSKHHDFCYGTMRVRKITDHSTDKAGITTVTFSYFIPSLPLWAKNRSIRFANTDLDNFVMGVDSERYQVSFYADKHGGIHMVSEPEQLDFVY